MAASSTYYTNLKSAISNDGIDTRVEVNQRALIDKILARYATPGAVYRELIQNSNDADATVAEIIISTTTAAAAASTSVTSSLEEAMRGRSGKVTPTTTTQQQSQQLVTQVIYRNNGQPFRSQDWDRLRKIAEGNPDETKVGAFGVGAYTMFSICEEPMVVSGGCGKQANKGGGEEKKECMAFFWKGDSLWTKTGTTTTTTTTTTDESEDVDRSEDDNDGGNSRNDNNNSNSSTTVKHENRNWTSFIMPSRDPYPLPDMIEFGEFLAASLTFTKCLDTVRVYVDRTLVLNVRKTIVDCCPIVLPKASSWWKNDGAITTSSTGMFTFVGEGELTQTLLRLTVSLRSSISNTNTTNNNNNNGKNIGTMETSSVLARYASAKVKTSIPTNVESRMVRVTKKKPPKELTVQILLDSVNDDDTPSGSYDNTVTTSKTSYVRRTTKTVTKSSTTTTGASLIANSFAPVAAGCGRIFIGFRTSQTTGLGIHVSAPLLPTVEREAIDFVDNALREYNCELLEICGMLTRLVLENAMGQIGLAYEAGRDERDKLYLVEELEKEKETATVDDDIASTAVTNDDDSSSLATGKSSEKSTSLSSSLFGFASYMARGVKNTVTEMAIRPVQAIIGEDDETMELLNPRDDRAICTEERDAILLMRAYCPRPSTPDSLVGTCLARGFTRCLPASSPPVLTAGGVIRGSDAKLPYNGIEAFGFTNVVRRIMFENAKEYHELIANVKRLSMENLVQSISIQVLDEKMIIRLLKWWPKICRVDRSVERYGIQLKDAIKFEIKTNNRASIPSSATKKTTMTDDGQLTNVCRMDSILYVTPNCLQNLPLPETTFPPWLQNEIGLRTLENSVFRDWFTALPFDIWTSFISYHPCLVKGTPEEMNILVLAALGKHFDSLDNTRRFVELLPLDKIVIPFDENGSSSSVVSKIKMTTPKELYLSSSDLSAFDGVGVFNKVSNKLSKAGVSDSFLLALGVRNAISIEFLFLHLDTLRWNTNPKPLIKYLLEADLSPADMDKLRTTQYLPAENDQDHVYRPSELHFKRKDLEIFPFVRFLQWPEGMSNTHRNYLKILGVQEDPPLQFVMEFMVKDCTKEGRVRDWRVYDAALTFLTQRLGPNGIYEKEYLRQYTRMSFLACIRQNLENGEVVREMQSPSSCYYNPSALIMGFSTLDPQLDTIHVATRTQCSKDPSSLLVIDRLIQLVGVSNAKLNHLRDSGGNADERERLNLQILSLFDAVFAYLSTRNDFQKSDLIGLAKKAFIPCLTRGNIEFLPPAQIFFVKEKKSDNDANDVLTEKLFKQIKYNAFLSLVGVKTEPTLAEIFELMLEKPDQTLDLLGERSYKSVLQRIAAHPPFKHVTNRISSCPFLLGYLVVDEEVVSEEDKGKEQSVQYVLARAEDIYIVDNSFLRRQFPMLVAPMEQTLEDFYHIIGSQYVSEVVKKDFELQGRTYQNTALTMSLANRLQERRSLLLSPTNSSRPLATNAAKLIDEQSLEVVQVDVILGKYTFKRSSKHLKVTCCCKQQKNTQLTTLYVTTNPDWFDIASAIGAIILQRCQLEDALLLSQLLESPLETLRYRGFPVDRILRPISKPQPKASLPSPPLQPMPSLQSSPPTQSLEAKTHSPQTGSSGEEGFESILHQMFPHCPIDVIQDLLGKNPTQEKVREVADFLASMPPTDKDKPKQSSLERSSILDNKDHIASSKTMQKKKPGLMGKVLRGLPSSLLNNHNTGGGKMKPTQDGANIAGQRIIQELNDFSHTGAESKTPVSPERDASTQKSLENMLSQAVQASRAVDDAGIRSPETILNRLPHGLDRGSDGCEVIPAQNIHPFVGPHGNSKTRNGIRVFVTVSSSPTFITENFSAVEDFAVIVQHLAGVFQLNLATVAIYYDSNGTTIAFNADKSLYFNLRYYCALHQNKADIAGCYSYWYLTFAHELAHNLVTAHNKEHGSFTESIAALYLPQFAKMLSQL